MIPVLDVKVNWKTIIALAVVAGGGYLFLKSEAQGALTAITKDENPVNQTFEAAMGSDDPSGDFYTEYHDIDGNINIDWYDPMYPAVRFADELSGMDQFYD